MKQQLIKESSSSSSSSSATKQNISNTAALHLLSSSCTGTVDQKAPIHQTGAPLEKKECTREHLISLWVVSAFGPTEVIIKEAH